MRESLTYPGQSFTVSSGMQALRRNFFPIFATMAVAAGAPVDRAQTALPDSPFLSSTAPGPQTGSVEAFQLTGISVVGEKTFVSIYDAGEKHSLWIIVGESVGGIHVVSCDVATEQSVVRIGGQLKVLTLRKPAVTAAAFAPVPVGAEIAPIGLPTATGEAAVTPPLTEEDKEAREARMLVTDLLEIGAQQRKAYEEAQKKAAGQADNP